jgi:hypothetical protein
MRLSSPPCRFKSCRFHNRALDPVILEYNATSLGCRFPGVLKIIWLWINSSMSSSEGKPHGRSDRKQSNFPIQILVKNKSLTKLAIHLTRKFTSHRHVNKYVSNPTNRFHKCWKAESYADRKAENFFPNLFVGTSPALIFPVADTSLLLHKIIANI